jgi:hypothetical protein
MRRSAVAVIVSGYAFTGFGVAGGHHPVSGVHSAATKTVTATKTVEYQGYEISVPATWPVFQLDNDPTRCVRYDINAVYLGTPGASQLCPAGLVGRTQTVSIATSSGSGAPVVSYQRAAATAASSAEASQVSGAVVQEMQQHQVRLAMEDSSASVFATYGSDPTLVEGILHGLRRTQAGVGQASRELLQVAQTRPGAGALAARSRASAPPGVSPSPRASALAKSIAGPTVSAYPMLSAHPAAPARPSAPAPATLPAPPTAPVEQERSPQASAAQGSTANPVDTGQTSVVSAGRPRAPLPGFDACTAPSAAAMRKWRQKYSAAAIYIGGANMSCDYGNLSRSWIHTAEGLGWSLLPVYVGLQAPCGSFPGLITPKKAASQGKAAAQDAVAEARSFGMGTGTPIYFDMEAYDDTKARCRTAVLTFLDAWTREIQALRYVSGVYSSAGSAVQDLVSTSRVSGHPLAEPTALWFALWDNKTNLNGTPYLPASRWARNRTKQYMGGHAQKIGGITLNIDSDLVASPVVRALTCDRDALA